MCGILVIILLVLPVFTAVVSGKGITQLQENKMDTDKNANLKNAVITEAMKLSEEDFCEQALIAVLAIAKNNITANNIKITADMEKTDYNKELYSKLEKLYEKADLSISCKGETVYIPTATLSKGYTEADDSYPYMKSVASPWDCTNKNFVYEKEYPEGISLHGINYLCNEGMSAKEALKWYLPDFDIE